MTQQSYRKNSAEADSSASSSSSSASTSSNDVYPLPLSLGQKKITLNDEQWTVVSEPTDTNVETVGANICINDSSHIHIGNNTYIHKDAIVRLEINANDRDKQNGVVGQDEDQCNKTVTRNVIDLENSSVRTITAEHDRRKGMRKIFLISSIIFCIYMLASVLIPTSVSENATSGATVIPTTMSIHDSSADVYVPREKWGGKVPTSSVSVKAATLVVIKHTGGLECLNVESCRERIREIQKEHMEKHKFPDISYNFLIGGDEKIYIGRGLYVQNEERSDSMDIAFIGNFTTSTPTKGMLQLGRRVIIEAASPSVHAVDFATYYVVNHNQTEPTDSPGNNLFWAVTKWDYYSSALYFNHSISTNMTF